MCAGGLRGHKSSNRIELSQFIQDLLYFFWFCFPWFWGVGQLGGLYLGWPTIVSMSSGVLRDKESSNRIELSQLVQDLLNFGVLAPCGLGEGTNDWGASWDMGVSTHMCTCMHAHADTHMYWNCKWPPSWRHPCLSCLTCMCVHVHVCMGCPHTPTPTPTPIHSPPFPGWTPRISKNSITLQPIKIIQFCLKIWNLWGLPHTWVGVWFGGWMGGVSQITKNV